MPDQVFAQFLLCSIRGGFRIGVRSGVQFRPAKGNLRTAAEHPQVITAYLRREVELGRMQRVPTELQLSPPLLQISPCGVIPKKYRSNSWRLIVDLSSSEGGSIKGCLLAKLDLKEAYRAVPVHPSDRRLLGVSWDNHVYLDNVLPFGLRSAPKIFSSLTDAMMWMLSSHRPVVPTTMAAGLAQHLHCPKGTCPYRHGGNPLGSILGWKARPVPMR